jgi:hypothetical protein
MDTGRYFSCQVHLDVHKKTHDVKWPEAGVQSGCTDRMIVVPARLAAKGLQD